MIIHYFLFAFFVQKDICPKLCGSLVNKKKFFLHGL